jgi:hypothetical protein
MQMNRNSFVKFLKKSKLLDSRMIAGLNDSDLELSGSAIITILRDNWGDVKFIDNFSDALDASIISVNDPEMICQLANIAGGYSPEIVTEILRLSCLNSNTFQICGKICYNFCKEMQEKQALSYITKCKYYSFIAFICIQLFL